MPITKQTRRAIEVRNAAKLMPPTLTRAAESPDGSSHDVISGYAAVFNVVTELFRWDDDVFEEVVLPGAFAKSLARGDDVVCVIEHDSSKVVARRSSGTLDLVEDATGLKSRSVLAKTTKSADLVADIAHGNIKGMSFRFYPVSDREEIFDRLEPDQNNPAQQRKVRVYKRFISEVDISDVSPCVWPAYPTTTLQLGEGGLRSVSATRGGVGAPASFDHLPEWVRSRCEERAREKMVEVSKELRSRLRAAQDRSYLMQMQERISKATRTMLSPS